MTIIASKMTLGNSSVILVKLWVKLNEAVTKLLQIQTETCTMTLHVYAQFEQESIPLGCVPPHCADCTSLCASIATRYQLQWGKGALK